MERSETRTEMTTLDGSFGLFALEYYLISKYKIKFQPKVRKKDKNEKKNILYLYEQNFLEVAKDNPGNKRIIIRYK